MKIMTDVTIDVRNIIVDRTEQALLVIDTQFICAS